MNDFSKWKIEKLIKGILEIQPYWEEDEHKKRCPICDRYVNLDEKKCESLDDIQHSPDCVYLLSKEMMKEGMKN
jgi:hypothetical protein